MVHAEEGNTTADVWLGIVGWLLVHKSFLECVLAGRVRSWDIAGPGRWAEQVGIRLTQSLGQNTPQGILGVNSGGDPWMSAWSKEDLISLCG